LNFLAHFQGDFARGTPEHLRENYPEDLVQGILLHRAIDRFTDSHPVFLESKKLLHPSRRRFAGIIIDIFFDHLLAHSWADYSQVSLRDFVDDIHSLLSRRSHWLDKELQSIVSKMRDEDWLGTYGTIPGLTLTFERMSQRRDFLAPLIGSEEDLVKHYHSFSKAFQQFYPELLDYVRSENPGGAFNSP